MNSLVSYLAALLCIQGPRTVLDSQELHESVRLLDGDLRNLSVGVEDMEDVALRHLLARKVPNEQSGAGRKLVPSGLVHVSPLLVHEVVILALRICCPWPVFCSCKWRFLRDNAVNSDRRELLMRKHGAGGGKGRCQLSSLTRVLSSWTGCRLLGSCVGRRNKILTLRIPNMTNTIRLSGSMDCWRRGMGMIIANVLRRNICCIDDRLVLGRWAWWKRRGRCS